MVSSYAAFGIVFMFFWGIYYLCNKNNCVEYSLIELLLFYIFTRIVPVLMIPERKTEIWILLLLEWIIFGLLSYYLYSKKTEKVYMRVIAFYLFCPLSILFILSGDSTGMLYLAIALVSGCAIVYFARKKATK